MSLAASTPIAPLSAPPAARRGAVDTTRSTARSRLAAWLACHDFPGPRAHGAEGITPLMLAAAQGEADVVDALLAAGAPIDAQDDAGNTALWHACLGNAASATPVITRLIDAGVDIDHANDDDITCLMQAAACGNVEIMELLLQQGSCPTLCAPDGRCASDMAADRGKQLLCALVRQNGACLRDLVTRRLDSADMPGSRAA